MSNKNIPGEVVAAITMAIYEIQDQAHDIESNVLTIKRVPNEYLPWSNKQNMMLQTPTQK